MFRWFEKYRISRNRRVDKVDLWIRETVVCLLEVVIPKDEPFYYDSAFSFLQYQDKELSSLDLLNNPIRLTLFLPDFPLAIDVVGAGGRANYLDSAKYISRKDWDSLQSGLSIKTERLALYQCPYLIIRDSDPVDVSSLRERVKALSDRTLRS